MPGGWEQECMAGAPCDSPWIIWYFFEAVVFVVGLFRVFEWVSSVLTEMWTALRG